MKKVRVRCTLIVDVEFEDGYDHPEFMFFDIEENHCPGTGRVGAAIEKVMKDCGDRYCWGCNMLGENEIIEIDGTRVEDIEELKEDRISGWNIR